MVMKSAPAKPDANPNSEELKFKGVRKRKWGKWVSEIRLPNSRERIWLGSYDSPIKAARAFDAAQICLRGPSSANLNFPDNPPRIDSAARGLTPAEIQVAATAFANAEVDHRPPPVAEEEASTCSVSVSDGAVESESSGDVSFDSGTGPVLDYCYDFDTLEILGSGNFDASFGFVSGLGDFYAPQHSDISSDYFEYDNWNGLGYDDSFLWNF